MRRQTISVPGFDDLVRRMNVPISAAVRVGDLLFLSGAAPVDLETGQFIRGDLREQTRRTLDFVKRVLELGGSSLADVVKTTVYCTRPDEYAAVNEVYAEYFGDDPPARTFITVGAFYIPIDIEIECVAVVTG